MNIVDLLVTIVVVTILVTIILAIVTYVAYKLRLSREPSQQDEERGPRYFVAYSPRSETEAAEHERVRVGQGAVEHATEA